MGGETGLVCPPLNPDPRPHSAPPQVLWTRLPCDNFHLLIACSILQSQRGELIGSDHDFNTILKVGAHSVHVCVCVCVCV